MHVCVFVCASLRASVSFAPGIVTAQEVHFTPRRRGEASKRVRRYERSRHMCTLDTGAVYEGCRGLAARIMHFRLPRLPVNSFKQKSLEIPKDVFRQ